MSKEILKADLHVHSRFSPDSLAWVWQIEEERKRKGLDYIGITDHNTLTEAAKILKKDSGTPFVLGEEVLTSDTNSRGKKIEIIGMFLQEPIAPGQTIKQTIFQINAQRGVVVIPHPFDEWRHGAGARASRAIINDCLGGIPVAIEVFNARAGKNANFLAKMLWCELRNDGVLATAGSDAHRIAEIGRGYVGLPPFQTTRQFSAALAEAKACGEVNAWGTLYQRLLNRIELAMGKTFSDLRKELSPDFNYR